MCVHKKTLPPYRLAAHDWHPRKDELVYEEKDDTFVSLHKTTSQHYVVTRASASATTPSEVLLLYVAVMPSRFHFTAPQRPANMSRSLST